MQLEPFQLERYFAKHEFSAPYLLSPSDIEPLRLPELLAMASADRRHQWDNLWRHALGPKCGEENFCG